MRAKLYMKITGEELCPCCFRIASVNNHLLNKTAYSTVKSIAKKLEKKADVLHLKYKPKTN
jgi:hypothetical protein